MVDNVVEAVRKDLLDRSQVGVKKYGVTLDRNDLSLKDWLQHAYEECLDQANYLKRAILQIESEEFIEQMDKEARERYPKTMDILGKMVEDNQKNGFY